MNESGKRVVVSALGDDPMSALDDLAAIEDQPPPDVSALGPRDVVIEVRSAAVGWVDLIMMSGQYQHVPEPPYTPGLEYAGVVAWAGAEAEIPVGARVVVDPFLAGPRSHGAYRAYGGFASYAVAPAEAVYAIPGALSFDEACNLLGNYETAYHCLVTRGRVAAGETVMIHGASGSTGLAAVHVAKLLGATVIATGRSEERLAAVRAQGADHVLATTRADGAPGVRELRGEVKALTAGRGVDVVYDGVGGGISVERLRCLRFGGRVLIDGGATDPLPFEPPAASGLKVVAVDVSAPLLPDAEPGIPSAFETLIGVSQMLTRPLTQQALARRQPDVLILGGQGGVVGLDFLKAGTILTASEPLKDETKRKGAALLGR